MLQQLKVGPTGVVVIFSKVFAEALNLSVSFDVHCGLSFLNLGKCAMQLVAC